MHLTVSQPHSERCYDRLSRVSHLIPVSALSSSVFQTDVGRNSDPLPYRKGLAEPRSEAWETRTPKAHDVVQLDILGLLASRQVGLVSGFSNWTFALFFWLFLG